MNSSDSELIVLTDFVTIHIDFVNGKHLQILDKGLIFSELDDCYLVTTQKQGPGGTTIREIINKIHVMNIEFLLRQS